MTNATRLMDTTVGVPDSIDSIQCTLPRGGILVPGLFAGQDERPIARKSPLRRRRPLSSPSTELSKATSDRDLPAPRKTPGRKFAGSAWPPARLWSRSLGANAAGKKRSTWISNVHHLCEARPAPKLERPCFRVSWMRLSGALGDSSGILASRPDAKKGAGGEPNPFRLPERQLHGLAGTTADANRQFIVPALRGTPMRRSKPWRPPFKGLLPVPEFSQKTGCAKNLAF